MNCCLRILRSSSSAWSASETSSAFSISEQDVAHAEDPLRHPLRVEALELLELLAGRGVHDRLAGDRLDRQRGAAAGVAVELGQHHAVELDPLGEALGDVDRVLAGHRVDHQQDVVGLGPPCGSRPARPSAPSSTCRRPAVSTISTSRPADLRLAQRPLGDVDRVALGALLVDGRAARLPIVTSCSTAAGRCVSQAASADLLAVVAEVLGELRAGGRLARALQAGHQDHGRRPSEAKARSRLAPPISAASSSLTILTTCWPGLRRVEHAGAEAALLDLRR